MTAYLLASVSSLQLDEDWSNTPVAFDIQKIEGDESNESCLFVDTDSIRFRLLSRGNEEYMVLNVEQLLHEETQENKDDQNFFQKAAGFAKDHPYKAALIGVPLTVAGAGVAATAAGFGATGIIGGSIAASIQSGMGSVASSSLFASMQSLGATGMFSAMTSGGVAAGAAGAAAVAATNSGNTTHAEKDRDPDEDVKSGSEKETCESEENMEIFLGSKAKIVESKKLLIFYEK